MGGIVAVMGKAEEKGVGDALARIRHRGPDGDGCAVVGKNTVAQCRLVTGDPAASVQPGFNGDKSLAAVCDGTLYNVAELQGKLPGHKFATGGDAEVLAHLYEEKGTGGFRDLDGMYAFVVAGKDRIVAGRDPIGLKPLYYMEDGRAMWFASEIKALYGAGKGEIKEFPCGRLYDSAKGWMTFREVDPKVKPMSDPKEAFPIIRGDLDRAVAHHLKASVPPGVFLSGGFDSSLIAVLMAKALGGKIKTFSVGMPGAVDLDRAGELSATIGSDHTVEVIDEKEAERLLPEIIRYLESYDRDLIRSSVPCYFASRLAAKQVKVILTGEGSDELFGGYRHLQGYRKAEDVQAELIRLILALHNMGLQRGDRMMGAHGLDGRLAFLDLKVIESFLSIDPQLKVYTREHPEKWLVRAAFQDILPEKICWRLKQQFDEGSKAAEVMPRLAGGKADLAGEQKIAAAAGLPPLQDAEEAWYFHLFRQHYDPARVKQTLGRWIPPQAPQS